MVVYRFAVPDYVYKDDKAFLFKKYICLSYTTWILQKNIYIVKSTITMPRMTIKRSFYDALRFASFYSHILIFVFPQGISYNGHPAK